jgi:hypothetical protein
MIPEFKPIFQNRILDVIQAKDKESQKLIEKIRKEAYFNYLKEGLLFRKTNSGLVCVGKISDINLKEEMDL